MAKHDDLGDRMKGYEGAFRLSLPRRLPVIVRVQSDEISILLHNYKRLSTGAWFDNDLQKIASISSAVTTCHFLQRMETSKVGTVAFDARAFVLPEAEVVNYFLWRQNDATRNSIQMAARAVYSHKECENKSLSELQEMLFQKGINWNDYPVGCKRGWALFRKPGRKIVTSPKGELLDIESQEWVIEGPPIFSQDRDYIQKHLAVESEDA